MKPKPSELNGKRQPTTRPLRQWCWLPLFMIITWVGCKQKARVPADTNPVGTYALVSVDGNKVPGTVQHEGHALAVQSGSFTINSDGTCSSKMVLSGRDAAIEVKATYTRQGAKLTMQWAGAGTTTGTLEGDTFTMNNEGMVFAYRK